MSEADKAPLYVEQRFIERPPVFLAQRFDAENPTPIIQWLRDNMSDGYVGFHFEHGEKIDTETPIRALHVGRNSAPEATVRDGQWLVRNWPDVRGGRAWSVVSEEEFRELFAPDPYQDLADKAAE